MAEFVRLEVTEGIGTIRLDRPPVNALNDQLTAELTVAAAEAGNDTGIRAVLGVMPGAGGTQRLPRLIGPARAKDMIFTGRMVPAAEALAIGLLDRVAPDEEVYATALELVQRYVAGPALALRAAKQAVDSGLGVDLTTGLEIERIQFAALFGTQDQREGMRSFLDNGPGKAAFTGR